MLGLATPPDCAIWRLVMLPRRPKSLGIGTRCRRCRCRGQLLLQLLSCDSSGVLGEGRLYSGDVANGQDGGRPALLESPASFQVRLQISFARNVASAPFVGLISMRFNAMVAAPLRKNTMLFCCIAIGNVGAEHSPLGSTALTLLELSPLTRTSVTFPVPSLDLPMKVGAVSASRLALLLSSTDRIGRDMSRCSRVELSFALTGA